MSKFDDYSPSITGDTRICRGRLIMTQWCYCHLWRRSLWTEMTAGSPSLKIKGFFKISWSTTELNGNIHSDDNSNNYKWRKYIIKKILQNHGLIDGSMLYNVKNYKFCQWNHISKLNKKIYTDSIFTYFYDQETMFLLPVKEYPIDSSQKSVAQI